MTNMSNKHNINQNKIVCESLREAIIILMESTEYSKITITELCQKAGVSRMAFYNNYSSKDNLLKQVIFFQTNRLIDQIGSPFREKTPKEWYVKLFEYIYVNNKYLKIIFNSGLKFEYLSAINDLVLHSTEIAVIDRYLRLMWAGGMVNTIIYWVESNLKAPVQDLAQFCFNNLSVWTK